MSGTETTATPEAPHATKEEKEKFRWDKLWWWGMVVFVILLLIVATALALAKVNNKTDGVLAAVNDTRKDLEKKINGLEGKMGTFATISDHNGLVDRVAKHEKEDSNIHRAQARAVRPTAEEALKPHASAAQEDPLPASSTAAASEPSHTANSEQKPERVDVVSLIADACGERGIVRSGRFRSDGSEIWRCADEVRVVQQEVSVPRGGVINVSPQQQFYGVREQESPYSWSQAAKAGGAGCVVGAIVDHGVGCVRGRVGAVAGDFVDQKVVKNDSHIGAMVGGAIGAGASWRYRHPPAPQGTLVGGPVGMAP